MHGQIDGNRHPVLKTIFVLFIIAVLGAVLYFAFLYGTHEHTSNVWTEETPATCTSQGLRYRVCEECGESYSREIIPQLGHDYEWELVDAEGDSSLKMVGACSSCDVTRELPVSWSEVVVNTTEPTCGNAGKITYTAFGYNGDEKVTASRYESIPALEHVPTDAVIENIVEAGCTVDGSYDTVVYCSICNGVISRTTIVTEGMKGHVDSDPVVENYVAATCTENGSYEHVVYCSVCNDELSREAKTLFPIPHPYAWTLIREDETTFKMSGECECGETALCDVDYDTEITVKHDYECLEPGTTTYTATITYEDIVVSATYTTSLPFTGYHTVGGVDIEEYRIVDENGASYFNLSVFGGNINLIYDKEAGETELDAWNAAGFASAIYRCEVCGAWIHITVFNDMQA